MLVLTRKSDESIIIDGDIRVTVLGITGTKVRIGIEAPNDIPIRRQEIIDAMIAEPTHSVVRQSPSPVESGRVRSAETVG